MTNVSTSTSTTMSQADSIRVPSWKVSGDWFDVWNCNIPCPCEFAQAPTFGNCDGILAWHIQKGIYGDISLDRLNILGIGTYTGNIWAEDRSTKITAALFFDEMASEQL